MLFKNNLVAYVLGFLVIILMFSFYKGSVKQDTGEATSRVESLVTENVKLQPVDQNINEIDIKVFETFTKTPEFQILDIRTPEEYSEGHIQNAINYDFYSKDFISQLDGLDKNKKYLMYCRSGSRTKKTIPMLEQLGFRDVQVLEGGLLSWNKENLPLFK